MTERKKFPISVQLILENQNKILLMKRKNTGYEDGKYCLPGGHVESNEEIKQALIREAEEELGITINVKDVQFYKVLNRKINENEAYIDFVFKVMHWSKNVTNNEKDKCEEIIWIDKNKLPKNILDFIPTLLEENNFAYLPYNWEENFDK